MELRVYGERDFRNMLDEQEYCGDVLKTLMLNVNKWTKRFTVRR